MNDTSQLNNYCSCGASQKGSIVFAGLKCEMCGEDLYVENGEGLELLETQSVQITFDRKSKS